MRYSFKLICFGTFTLDMMRNGHIKAFIVCIFILIPVGAPQKFGVFEVFPGLKIRNAVASVILSQDHTECCLRCLVYDGCYGGNYNENDRVCEINTFGLQGNGEIIDRNETWTLYYRSNVLGKELMLRATAGTGVGVKDTWLGKNSSSPSQDTCTSMTTGTCSTHYRNPKVDFWERLSISEVNLELYMGGSKVAFLTFSGIGSDIKSWMSPERLLTSSWTSVNSSTTYLYFSVDGHASCARTFFIQKNYGGCDHDAGWLVILDPPSLCCIGSWDSLSNKPVFLYSTVDDAVTYKNGAGVGIADVMAIFVKYK